MRKDLEIKEVSSKSDLEDFIRFPWKVYEDYPRWVAPLLVSQEKLFDFRKNPFWAENEFALFMACQNNKLVARIALIVPRLSDTCEVGHFGFLETLEDQDTFLKLWDFCLAWFRGKSVKRIMGPFNPSLHHESGLLIEGFEYSPFLFMPYNPPYYKRFYQKAGLKKGMDFWAYSIPEAHKILSQRIIKITDFIADKYHIQVRPANLREKAKEVEIIRLLYNQAFCDHWGFTPVTQEVFSDLADDLLQIADPELMLIAEVDSTPVGFVLCAPNFNEVLAKNRNGKLFPLGIVKLLWLKRKIKTVRVMVIGVLPEYRKMGVAPILIRSITEKIIEKGFTGGEISWVAENNFKMNKAALSIGGKRYKKTRIYQREI